MAHNMPEIALICRAAATRALTEKFDFDEFKALWPLEADNDQLLWKLMHETEHLLVDQDLHQKDPSYAEHQKNVVKSLIADVDAKYSALWKKQGA
jgi:hypothetical protein